MLFLFTTVELHHLSPVKIILQPAALPFWGLSDLAADMWLILLFMNRSSQLLQGSWRALMKLCLQFFLLSCFKSLKWKTLSVFLQRTQRKKLSHSLNIHQLVDSNNITLATLTACRGTSLGCISLDYEARNLKAPLIYIDGVVGSIHSTQLQKWTKRHSCARSLNPFANRTC